MAAKVKFVRDTLANYNLAKAVGTLDTDTLYLIMDGATKKLRCYLGYDLLHANSLDYIPGGGDLVAHASTHGTDGVDPLSTAMIGAISVEDFAVFRADLLSRFAEVEDCVKWNVQE